GLALTLLLLTVPNSAEAVVPPATNTSDITSLPAPYSQWDVTIGPVDGDARVLDLDFNSPLLHRRVSNRVYLPDRYRIEGAAYPVVYALHGTVLPALDDHTVDPVTQQESLLHMIGAGGGYLQTELFDLTSQLDKATFVVVAPDTGTDKSWCETCGWIDGRKDLLPNVHPVTGETLPADSHLHRELYPLVEALFNVRSDRAGRGVMGFSMGGYAALVQGMLHPDQYAFVASVSGVYETLTEPRLRAIWEALGYMRDQGYGTGVTDEIWWRNYDPSQIATNLAGFGGKLLLSYGDACLSTASLATEDCRTYPPVRNPAAATIEALLVANNHVAVKDLPAKTIPAQFIQLPGVHGANNHRVYADYIVPSANDLFSRKIVDPRSFSYRTVIPHFAVWGYDVSVERQDDEFLSLGAARADGSSFTLTGTGTVRLRTPAAFTPGSTHRIIVTAQDGSSNQQIATADSSGRLGLTIKLGGDHPLDQGTLTDVLSLDAANSTNIQIK
ncbi:alpha/beta hydrolase-fold protein, partial [Pseudonocardia sp.]|uniref:alpha/beta hydrolase n=1 Tax=Pseudonocardia sp. TaxID=60912 RepID=UPI002633CC37